MSSASYNREREKEVILEKGTTLTTIATKNIWGQDSSTNHVSEPFTVKHKEEKMTDVVTPGYAALSNEGKIINNAMSQSKASLVCTTPALTYRVDTKSLIAPYGWESTTRVSGQMGPAWLWDGYDPVNEPTIDNQLMDYKSPVDVDLMKNIAVMQAFAKIDEANANIYATIGELGKTVSYVATVIKRIVLLLKQFSKAVLQLRNVVGSVAKISDLWLEYRYAIRPLYFEVEGLLKAFDSDETLRTRLSSSDEWTDSDSDSVLLEASDVNVTRTTSYNRKISVSAGVLLSHDIQKMSLAMKLGTQDLPLGAWELVPYSFIIDWVFNVGTWLKAWTPHVHTSVIASWVTVRTETRELRTISNVVPTPTKTDPSGHKFARIESFVPGGYTRDIVTVDRTPDVAPSSIPQLNLKLNIQKGIDIIAIFADLKGIDKTLKGLRGR